MTLREKLAAWSAAIRQALHRQSSQSNQRRLAADLRESEELHRIILSNISDAVFITDQAGNLIYICPNVEVIFGYTFAEVARQGHIAHLLGDNLFDYPALLAQGELVNLERTITDKAGQWHSLLINVKKVAIKQGTVLYTCRDITERKLAEQALQASEERFRQVIVSISDHIYVTEYTATGEYINRYISPHIEALTGYPLEKFMADRDFWPSTVIHPDDRTGAARQSERLTLGQDSETEYRIVTAAGDIVWVRDSGRVQTESSSRIIYGVVSNVTQRKVAEEAVHQLNEALEQRVIDRTRELAALYEVTAVASETLNPGSMLELALERVLAAARVETGTVHLIDEASGKLQLATQKGLLPATMLALDALTPNHALVAPIIQQRKPLVVTHLARSEQWAWLHTANALDFYVGVPMQARNEVLGVLSVFGSTAQQLNAEEVTLLASVADQMGVAVENLRLRQQAEEAAIREERSRLARELHDSVTQSLYSLTLFAELGAEKLDQGQLDAARQRLQRIEATARQALKEMRLLVYELRPMLLEQDGLHGALRHRLEAVEERGRVSTHLHIEPGLKLPAPVEAGLYRIAQETLNNALKHASAETVTVKIETEGRQVVLETIDDGRGFDAEAVKDKGGLGLRSIQERVEQLGGTLCIQSEAGVGTRIRVVLELNS